MIASLITVLGIGLFTINTYAEDTDNAENSETATPKTSLTLMPVSRTLQIASNSSYDGTMSVSNDGTEEVKIEVYAAPYSYVYSEDEDSYKLGFSNENNFTQITRWIKIKDNDGNYVERPSFTIPAGETLNIDYRIDTPNNIPAGGQYAVIFAQTISGSTNASGIKTEASAGIVIYGHSAEGTIDVSAEIRDMEIGQGTKSDGSNNANNNLYGFAKVKNTGNIDFFARGVLKVEPIFGFGGYETASNSNSGNSPSVIPESERVVIDEWKETPSFGLYKVTWTITAGENTETIEKVVFLINPIIAIIAIIVLTIIVISIIIGVRKRKEHKSRLAI